MDRGPCPTPLTAAGSARRPSARPRPVWRACRRRHRRPARGPFSRMCTTSQAVPTAVPISRSSIGPGPGFGLSPWALPASIPRPVSTAPVKLRPFHPCYPRPQDHPSCHPTAPPWRRGATATRHDHGVHAFVAPAQCSRNSPTTLRHSPGAISLRWQKRTECSGPSIFSCQNSMKRNNSG